MKKMERKENANKGFSLVELIVVVAIMAVLVGILAPQYLRYVEKTRLQKDNSAIAEIANAIKIAMADADINASVKYTGVDANNEITFTRDDKSNQKLSFDASSALQAELAKTVGSSVTTGSSTYREATDVIKLTIKNDGGVISVEAANWIEKPGDGADKKNF